MLGSPSVRRTTLLVLAALMLLSACSLTSTTGSGPLRLAGVPASVPDEPLAELDQQSFENVLTGFSGRGIVVNVWASWCGPCQAEAPLLRRAHRADGEAVAFIGVASRAARRPGYPNVADPSGGIARWLGSQGLPTTVFFDASGRRKATIKGALTEQVLAGQLAELRG